MNPASDNSAMAIEPEEAGEIGLLSTKAYGRSHQLDRGSMRGQDDKEEQEEQLSAKEHCYGLLPPTLPPLPAAAPAPLHLLLVGEGRSGTSLGLDMLSSTMGPATFSIFEPYHNFFKHAVEEHSLSSAPGHGHGSGDSGGVGEEGASSDSFPGGLESLFNCSFATNAESMPGSIWFVRSSRP